MKTFSLLSLAVAATFTFSSAKAANNETDINFNQISFADGINIELVEGNTPKIETYDSNVTYTINDNVLTLKASAGNSKTNAHVRICAPSLSAIQYFGDNDVMVSGNLNANKMLVSNSGNGDITINSITSRNLVCGVLGDGDIRINNVKTQDAKCAVWGTGKVVMADETSDAVVTNHSRLKMSDCRYSANRQNPNMKACYSLRNVNVHKSNNLAAR